MSDDGGPAAETDVAQTAVPVVAGALECPSPSEWERDVAGTQHSFQRRWRAVGWRGGGEPDQTGAAPSALWRLSGEGRRRAEATRRWWPKAESLRPVTRRPPGSCTRLASQQAALQAEVLQTVSRDHAAWVRRDARRRPGRWWSCADGEAPALLVCQVGLEAVQAYVAGCALVVVGQGVRGKRVAGGGGAWSPGLLGSMRVFGGLHWASKPVPFPFRFRSWRGDAELPWWFSATR